MNVKRMTKIERMKQAQNNIKDVVILNSIEQKIAARTSVIGVLKACIEACNKVGNVVRANEFYSKAVATGEEIKQLYVQLETIGVDAGDQ